MVEDDRSFFIGDKDIFQQEEPVEVTERDIDREALEKAKLYIGKNIVEAQRGKTKCVDGRPNRDMDNAGMLARPGGDMGMVMTLWAMNVAENWGLNEAQCFQMIYDLVV